MPTIYSILRLTTLLLLLSACQAAPPRSATATPPATAQARVASANDSDGDGIPNEQDRCEGFLIGTSTADAFGCATVFVPETALVFDHDAHAKWYGRFWTGSCEGVPGFCLPGDPSWFAVTAELAAGFPPDEQGVVRNRLWALGRAVGHEWASDPELNDKRIFTPQLRAWGNQLQNSDDLLATLTALEGEVCSLLGAQALESDLSPAEACLG